MLSNIASGVLVIDISEKDWMKRGLGGNED